MLLLRYRRNTPHTTHMPNRHNMRQCYRRNTCDSKLRCQSSSSNSNSSITYNSRRPNTRLPNRHHSCRKRRHLVRITPSQQTALSDCRRPHPRSQLRNSCHSPPPPEAIHRRPPWCMVVPHRARPYPRMRLLSRHGRPSRPAPPTRCRLFSRRRARVGSIRSGTSGPFGTAVLHLVEQRNVRLHLEDIPRPRFPYRSICFILHLALYSSSLHVPFFCISVCALYIVLYVLFVTWTRNTCVYHCIVSDFCGEQVPVPQCATCFGRSCIAPHH